MRSSIWLGCIMIGAAIEQPNLTEKSMQAIVITGLFFLVMDLIELVKK